MERQLNEAIGSLVHGEEDNIGKVVDFYLDGQNWAIRYLVVETGGLFNRNKVLLAPSALIKSNWDTKEFFTNLTKEQLKNSPDIDTNKPVSRQTEKDLHQYYDWPVYWGGVGGVTGDGGVGGVAGVDGVAGADGVAVIGGVAGIGGVGGAGGAGGIGGVGGVGSSPISSYVPVGMTRSNEQGDRVSSNEPGDRVSSNEQGHVLSSNEPTGDPNLRSIKEISGYHIHTEDQKIGSIDDFIIDDETWNIRYLLVDAHELNHGKKLLLSPLWLGQVIWDESEIFIELPIEVIKNSPDYDDSKPMGPDYEQKLHEHYKTLK